MFETIRKFFRKPTHGYRNPTEPINIVLIEYPYDVIDDIDAIEYLGDSDEIDYDGIAS